MDGQPYMLYARYKTCWDFIKYGGAFQVEVGGKNRRRTDVTRC